MRKVFLDELPKFKEGNSKSINWLDSIGCEVKFIYDDIEGIIKIIDYYRDNVKHVSYLKVQYENLNYNMSISDLASCTLGGLLGTHTKRYKYNINDIITNIRSGKLKILEQIKVGNKNIKGYKYECLICNNIDTITEYNLNENIGCNVCTGKKVLKGYNDLWTTHPAIAKLLKYSERGYEISYGKGMNEIFICADCHFEKKISPNNITKYGFNCNRCSDGISYPEKFMINMWQQMKINFVTGEIFEWSQKIKNKNIKLCGDKIYDFYIQNKELICEINGMQHYERGFSNIDKRARTLEEEQENDKIKKELALKNKIKYYIVIDARQSEFEFIKNNILNSELSILYDLSNIDWLKCHEFACSSLVKVACDLWNSKQMNITEISKKMYLANSTVTRYLKQGTELNWCKYTPKQVLTTEKIKTICLNTKEIFESLADACRYYRIQKSTMTNCCKNRREFAGKHPDTGEYLKWMYYKDWLKQQDINFEIT